MLRYQKLDSRSSKKGEILPAQTITAGSNCGLADLDEVARRGALQLLQAVLEAEVEEFLGRKRYGRSNGAGERFRGYRNGFGKERRVTVGSGTLPIRAPRVRQSCEPFESMVLSSYQRRSPAVKELIPELYVQGLATGDFEPALRGLLGEGAALSPSTIVRLKQQWQAEYEAWRTRPYGQGYAYLWCDGVYPKAGLQGDKTAFLVVLGVNAEGVKEPLAIMEGYRESTESWAEILRDLKARGLTDPKLFVGDGVLGLWGAINQVYPQAEHQRCWCHKMRNVLTHFPKRLQGEVKLLLQRMYNAATKQESLELMQQFAKVYEQHYPRAVECLLKDQEPLLTFYQYPREQWASIKTTNPIESVFATLRLRTNAARRIKSPQSVLPDGASAYLIFQLFRRAERNWRRLNAPHLVSKVIQGVNFKDGIEISKEMRKQPEMVAA